MSDLSQIESQGEAAAAAQNTPATAPADQALLSVQHLDTGYGETQVRGRKSFDALMASLPKLRGRTDAAGYLKKLREAALAEDSGEKLQEELRKLAEA